MGSLKYIGYLLHQKDDLRMSNQFLEIKKTLDNANVHNKYIYLATDTKFIYDNSSLGQVIGLNYSIRNKIVVINDEIERNNKRFVLLSVDDIKIGWIEADEKEMLRLYRLPKVNGKLELNNALEFIFNNISYQEEVEQLKNRIIKAQYLFYYNEELYLIVSKIDKKFFAPIKSSLFRKLIFPNVETKIFLNDETSLYYSSNFNSKGGEVTKQDYYEVVSYVNGTNEVRIEYQNQKYWILHEDNMPFKQEFHHDLDTLEVIDFITYLSESNKYYRNHVKVLENKLNRVKNNISYHSLEEKIYFTGKIGDSNVN